MTRLRKWLSYAIAAVLVAVGVFAVGGVTPAYAEDPVLGYKKQLQPNGDGTYTLSLSVTGDSNSSSSSSKANVVIVFDTSNSMDKTAYTYSYVVNNGWGGNYGLVDGKYVELDYDWWNRVYTYTDATGTHTYNGTRYSWRRTRSTRLQVAKDATTSLIKQLLANNTAENPDLVEVALVDFGGTVNSNTEWANSTNATSLVTTVNNFRTPGDEYDWHGGTNWEAALTAAKSLAGSKTDGDPTYVIFVSDGNPTYRSQAHGYDKDYNKKSGVYGTGSDDPDNRNYDAAKGVAEAIEKSYTLYSVGAFGDPTKMQSIVTDPNKYYDASDSNKLNAAFADILSQITNAVGFKDVNVTDNVTSLTASTLVNGDANSFTYTRSDQESWTDAPQASFQDGKVSWDLSSLGRLDAGVTYTVSFKVWPSQDALDLVANLNNGKTSYDQLTPEQKAQISEVKDDSGNVTGYALYSNTDGTDPDNPNGVSYTTVKTTTQSSLPEGATQNEDDTWTAPDGSKWVQNDNGTYTGTTETSGSATFERPTPMALASSQMTIEKKFENNVDPQTEGTPESVTLTVKSDGTDYLTKELSNATTPAYSDSLYIAPGLIDKDGNVLDTGHAYTVTENDYHWDIDAPTYRPMLDNGKLVMYKQVAEGTDGAKQIGNDWYVADTTAGATLTATNYRRSVIELTKAVDSKTEGVAAPDESFSFTGTVTDPNGSDVWFAVKGSDGQLVKDLKTNATAEGKDGAKTGYYYIGSGANLTVSLKADQTLRIINAPKGMKYSFTESDTMPDGFTFSEAKSNGTKVDGKTVSGEVTASNTTYTASFKNDYTSKSAKATIPVKKNLTVPEGLTAPNIAGKFTFTLAAVDGAPMPTENTEVTNPDSNGGTATFGEITYDKPGTYEYTVTESGKVAGVSNDSTSAKKVTVTVTDNGKGQLEATVNGGKTLEFTNAYSVGQTTATIPVEKTLSIPEGLTGPKDISGHYTFKLEAVDGAPVPTENAEIKNPASNGGTANFGAITYTKPGTYKYRVTETGTVPGVNNDVQATKEIEVVVKDNSNGTMTATVNGGEAVKFTNTYGITENGKASVTIPVSKTVQGDNAPAWSYDFVLAQDGKTLQTKTISSTGDTTATFDALTFDKPGTYTYTVTESGSVNGITNDAQASKTVTVTVTDNGDGTLSAVAKMGDQTVSAKNPVSFTNTYETTTFSVTKTWADGELSELRPSSVTVRLLADGEDTGKTLELTAANNWAGSFTDLPKNSDSKGTAITYSVTEDAVAGYDSSVDGGSVTNTAQTGSLKVSKTVAQTTPAAPDKTFTFTIQLDNTNVAGTFSDVSFEGGEATITLKAGESKTIEGLPVGGYTVTETALPGFTTTSTGATGTINKGETAEAAFTNTYGITSPAKADPPVIKAVEGDVPEGKMPTFEFTIAPDSTNPANVMPKDKDGKDVSTVTVAGAGSTEFGEITFTVPGTYTYTVTETQNAGGGWTYDTSTYKLAYTVTDNGEGVLTATGPVITKDGEPATSDTFTNKYASKGELDTSTETGVVLKKTVENSIDGANWESKTFEFTIAAAEGNPAEVTIDNPNGTATFTEAGTQNISFGKITFTKAGTYNFTLTETTQDGEGWTCDNTPKNVEVKVTDDGAGNLTATVSAPAEVTNTYGVEPLQGDTAVKLSATKSLTGNTLAAGQFKFELKDSAGKVLQTQSNEADGTVAFTGLEYTKPGTYEYTISEVNEGKDGYTYDGKTVKVTVTATDNGDGTMSADVKYDGKSDKPSFANSYTATGSTEGDASIYAKKTLTGRTLEANQFEFELKDSDGKVLQTKSNDEAGRVVFDPIQYDQTIFGEAAPTTEEPKADEPKADDTKAEEPATEDEKSETPAAEEPAAEPEAEEPEAPEAKPESEATNPVTELTNALAGLLSTTANAADNPRTKTFTYTISEKAANKAGYEYDSHVETVTVTVTDKGNGQLAVVTAYDEDGAVFANKYTATGETGNTVTATKTLTGRDMTEGEFEFQLLDKAGNEVATGKNDANGNVVFSSIKYDQTQVGEHEYTMVEKGGSKTGVTYDTSKLTAKVNVKDNGDGTLATEVTYPDGNTFKNTYKPLATSGYLKAQKVLEGRELKAGEFSFELLDASGKVIDTRTNAADGSVTFDNLSFDAAGEYKYQVREVKGDEANVTYTDKVANYTVKVEDVDGQLKVTSVTADGSDKAPVFTNTYTEPAAPAPAPEPAPEEPKTRPLPNAGDATVDPMPFAVLGLAVLAGGTVLRKRQASK